MRRSSRLGLLVSVSPTRRSIIVGPDVSGLRRELGPSSWVVLEEMLLSSTGDADDCTAAVSIRTLGASLGLAKDTVARAIRRLQAAGIVTAVPARTPAGTFETGSYRIAIPHVIAFELTHTSEPVDGSTHTCHARLCSTASRSSRTTRSRAALVRGLGLRHLRS